LCALATARRGGNQNDLIFGIVRDGLHNLVSKRVYGQLLCGDDCDCIQRVLVGPLGRGCGSGIPAFLDQWWWGFCNAQSRRRGRSSSSSVYDTVSAPAATTPSSLLDNHGRCCCCCCCQQARCRRHFLSRCCRIRTRCRRHRRRGRSHRRCIHGKVGAPAATPSSLLDHKRGKQVRHIFLDDCVGVRILDLL
jgi:hypothetical protein